MNGKVLLFALLLMQSIACQQDSPQKVAEKNVAAFVKSKMSKKAGYTLVSFAPLDTGDSSIFEISPHFLTHKFQSRTPNGEIVIEEWLFFMDSSLDIVAYRENGKGSQIPRSDFGENCDKVGAAADSVVNNIIKETIK